MDTIGAVSLAYFIVLCVVAGLCVLLSILNIVGAMAQSRVVAAVLLVMAFLLMLCLLTALALSIASWASLLATYANHDCIGFFTLKQLQCRRDTEPVLLNAFSGLLIVIGFCVAACLQDRQSD